VTTAVSPHLNAFLPKKIEVTMARFLKLDVDYNVL
jgi:hypothetical protein